MMISLPSSSAVPPHCRLRELRDAILGGRCSEMMELEGREPTMLKAKEKG